MLADAFAHRLVTEAEVENRSPPRLCPLPARERRLMPRLLLRGRFLRIWIGRSGRPEERTLIRQRPLAPRTVHDGADSCLSADASFRTCVWLAPHELVPLRHHPSASPEIASWMRKIPRPVCGQTPRIAETGLGGRSRALPRQAHSSEAFDPESDSFEARRPPASPITERANRTSARSSRKC